jgi:hypothetical protein
MAEIRIRNKNYGIHNFPDAESYLSKEHSEGRRFLRCEQTGFFEWFVFDECEPAEYAYRFDYASVPDMGAYLAPFAGCGWEHAGKFWKFHVFRKPKADGANGDIFPGNKSKAEMANKIIVFLWAFFIGSLSLTGVLVCVVFPRAADFLDEPLLWGFVMLGCYGVVAALWIVFGYQYYKNITGLRRIIKEHSFY